jgi:hypothetical protein
MRKERERERERVSTDAEERSEMMKERERERIRRRNDLEPSSLVGTCAHWKNREAPVSPPVGRTRRGGTHMSAPGTAHPSCHCLRVIRRMILCPK